MYILIYVGTVGLPMCYVVVVGLASLAVAVPYFIFS